MKTARARLLRDFALVELLAGLAAQFRILQPVEGEQRALQPSQLAQRRGDAVLPWIGGQLAQDQRGGHGARTDRGGDPQDVRPMGADQRDVDAPGDQRFERRDRPTPCRSCRDAGSSDPGSAARTGTRASEQRAKTWSESPPPSVWWRRVATSLWW